MDNCVLVGTAWALERNRYYSIQDTGRVLLYVVTYHAALFTRSIGGQRSDLFRPADLYFFMQSLISQGT